MPHIIAPIDGYTHGPEMAWLLEEQTALTAQVEIDPDACRDDGSFVDTYLRAGLVLGKITASGKYTEYDDAAVDGSETAKYVLLHDVDLRNPLKPAEVVDGPVTATVLIKAYIDATLLPNTLDANGKADLRTQGFMLKEDV